MFQMIRVKSHITFQRSMLDVNAHPNGIDTYTIQRFDSPNWIGLGSIGALGEPSYMFEATTLVDSLGEGNDSTVFRVIARIISWITCFIVIHMVDFLLIISLLESQMDSMQVGKIRSIFLGIQYSMKISNTTILKKILMLHFPMHRHFTPQIISLDQNVDASLTYYYRVRSIDDAGNQSEFSEIVQMSTLSHEKSMIIDQYVASKLS